jgi:hypothetical protein
MAKTQSGAPGLVDVLIARGTITTEAGTFGPGKVVAVPADEVAGLKARGVVLPDDYEAPKEVQDGRLKVTAESGVNVTSLGLA